MSEDMYEFSAVEETEDETRKRLNRDFKLFNRNKMQKRKNPTTMKSRLSFKEKRGERTVNQRKEKTCPICLRKNKQLKRHILTVHSDVSGVTLNEACKVSQVRDLSDQKKDTQKSICPVCGAQRIRIKSHLIKVYGMKKSSALLKEMVPVVEVGTFKARNESVVQWLKDYERLHFNQLDGACLSNKIETRKKTIKIKLSSVGKMLDFLVIRSKENSIEGALTEIRQLFSKPDGYVWTRKGKYGTLMKDLDNFKEFCAYARREGLANPLVISTAVERLTMARQNAGRKKKAEDAAFQDKDRQNVLLQSDIEDFNASPQASKALADLNGDHELGQRAAINARNYVITKILLDNNGRPSELDDMRQADLDDAKMKPYNKKKSEYYSVCSTSSKNISASGKPAYILITSETMILLDKYRKKARTVLATLASSDALFLKADGEAMVHQNISQGFRSIWKATARYNPSFKKQCNSRHFRHSANGLVKLCGDSNLRETVHIGLNHEKKTNKDSYMSIIRPIVSLNVKRNIKKLRETCSQKFENILKGDEENEDAESSSSQKESEMKTDVESLACKEVIKSEEKTEDAESSSFQKETEMEKEVKKSKMENAVGREKDRSPNPLQRRTRGRSNDPWLNMILQNI